MTTPPPASAAQLAAAMPDLPTPDDTAPEALALVAEVRRLTAAVVATDLDAAARAAIAGELATITDRIAATSRDDLIVLSRTADGRVENLTQAGSGQLNPAAPAVTWDPRPAPPTDGTAAPVEIRAHVTLTAAHSGPPGKAHGGVVATLLDEVIGAAAYAAGAAGLTAGLNIRFKAATPLDEPLTVTARYTHTDGRKHIATGEVRAGELVTATAEAILIAPASA